MIGLFQFEVPRSPQKQDSQGEERDVQHPQRGGHGDSGRCGSDRPEDCRDDSSPGQGEDRRDHALQRLLDTKRVQHSCASVNIVNLPVEGSRATFPPASFVLADSMRPSRVDGAWNQIPCGKCGASRGWKGSSCYLCDRSVPVQIVVIAIKTAGRIRSTNLLRNCDASKTVLALPKIQT